MKQVSTAIELQEALASMRKAGATIGLTPTMGALHAGHLALLRKCLEEGHQAVASIFVNPLQFGPGEDYTRYPRTLEADAALLEKTGAHLLYTPSEKEIYPQGQGEHLHVKAIGDHLEGKFRPGHFDGVATVVARLFSQVQPDAAYFGEKDWQQLQLIKQLVRDLNLNIHIIGVPIVREADGLALSSRNRYLSAEDRRKAPLIHITLRALAEDIRADPKNVDTHLVRAAKGLSENGFRLDYLELADETSCTPVTSPGRDRHKPLRLFIAAHLGNTRLIDNWAV
jgi:pantoate--beta-alanine ligase